MSPDVVVLQLDSGELDALRWYQPEMVKLAAGCRQMLAEMEAGDGLRNAYESSAARIERHQASMASIVAQLPEWAQSSWDVHVEDVR